MGSITPGLYAQMLARLEQNRLRKNGIEPPDPCAVEVELALHDEIIAECRRRGWFYIHHRTDRKSGIQKGCQDFTVFGAGRLFCMEIKSKTGKVKPDQLAWNAGMKHNGFTVFIVRSMQEVLQLFDGTNH